MQCWRFDLRRTFSRYLSGELDRNRVKRVEDHLLDCGICRTRLARMRNGHRLAQELPRFTPSRDHWHAIEAAISGAGPANVNNGLRILNWPNLVAKPGLALAVVGLIALAAAVFVASYRSSLREEHAGNALIAEALDLSEFHTVS